MGDAISAWLVTMRQITGTLEAPGAADNPIILGWADFIGKRFPKMKNYCSGYVHDSIAWCGLCVGYVMATTGIEPPYDPKDDLKSFFWAESWLGFGTPVNKPKPGDVLVFDFGNGDHHVTLFESDNGDGTWACRGGNQSDGVKVSNFAKSHCRGIRRPPAAATITAPIVATPSVLPALPKPTPASLTLFNKTVELVLVHEGGNDDDPRDPGGRTSRGILQSEWDTWRTTHPGLPSDVWQAPQDQILAIYREKYWIPLRCDYLPVGVSYAVFDYGVNSGVSRSTRVLQRLVGADVDGEIGPLTIAATAARDPVALVNAICDERLAFYHSLSTWTTFGRGWTNRIRDVRADALAMIESAAPTPLPVPSPGPIPTQQPPVPSPILIPSPVEESPVATPAPAPVPVPPPVSTAPVPPIVAAAPQVDIITLLQVLGTFAGAAVDTVKKSPQAQQVILSGIDKMLGGASLVGGKTPIGIIAIVGLFVLNALGQVGTTDGGVTGSSAGSILMSLAGGWTALGLTSKFDRIGKALASLALTPRGAPTGASMGKS